MDIQKWRRKHNGENIIKSLNVHGKRRKINQFTTRFTTRRKQLMVSTGVFATEEEREHLQEMLNLPVMFLSGGARVGLDPALECHRLALKHGLPEIQGYYGITKKGEFVRTA